MKIKLLIIILILGALGVAGYFFWPTIKSFFIPPMQPITLTTSDGVILSGNYMTPREPKGGVLLLHMMPATKESWQGLQEALAKAHISSLAIDLRGHGQSTQGPADITLDYHTFSDEQHQSSQKDVQAGIDYLTSQGITKSNISIIGASIGANLALQALALDPEIKSGVLLSPGLDYHGIETEQYVHGLSDTQSFFTIASKDDDYAFTSSRRLYDIASVKKDIGEYYAIGHGTTMLEKQPELITDIVNWIATR